MASQSATQFTQNVHAVIDQTCTDAKANLDWLQAQMHPYFFGAMQDEPEAVTSLALNLGALEKNRCLILAGRDDLFIEARPSHPDSLTDALHALKDKNISYAYTTNSYAAIPRLDQELEIHRFEFAQKSDQEICQAAAPVIPEKISRAIEQDIRQNYPDYDFSHFAKQLQTFWLNNEGYVRISSPRRVGRSLWLYQQTIQEGGISFTIEKADAPGEVSETRLLLGVGNPPQKEFLLQLIEIFRRLQLNVKRSACLSISNGIHPYFLGAICVTTEDGGFIEPGTELYHQLRRELYTTQLLASHSDTYQKLLLPGLFNGEDAALINAFIGFCHTNLAHNHPDSFDLEGVMRAFHHHPDISMQLVRLFRIRFTPELTERESQYEHVLQETVAAIDGFNTGRRFLDVFRKSIFHCALAFIRRTLKTNFFVCNKQALSFRLDPAYLEDLGVEVTNDLPAERPFRVTFFCGRHGLGYHIGFSDIARGGWRTLIIKGRDDYVTCANTIFRENYVLAHTQHLKNKDIYEGGSKMVAVVDTAGETDPERIKQRLYKLQYGFINAFLDIFLTENGIACDPQVVDYYREDEPIELGPDENMHDAMVELIAKQATKRGYMLGSGIMSSKQVGINHKEYGVTSTGVVKFAEVTMAELGIDMQQDQFSVKLTGGPNGDVAGNAMLLLLDQFPKVQIRLIIDGTGALYDPLGAEPSDLRRILLAEDLDAFNPDALHPGGFIIYRQQTRMDGIRQLYRKVEATDNGLEECWISTDEFYRDYNNLLFSVPADLFIPAGGRPETIDSSNWHKLFAEDGTLLTRAIIEGANSFITPAARDEIQKRGVVVIRDASANKCGVISSSYEIIANLLLSDEEFLAHKVEYVASVVDILKRRAEDEARLIFKRHRQGEGKLFTEISAEISTEINKAYDRLFNHFSANPQLFTQSHYRQVILQHLPELLRANRRFSERIDNLPVKIRAAILASEVASKMVYGGDEEFDFAEIVELRLKRIAAA